jgi:hypothetical protein
VKTLENISLLEETVLKEEKEDGELVFLAFHKSLYGSGLRGNLLRNISS